jgi:hypothetical protein
MPAPVAVYRVFRDWNDGAVPTIAQMRDGEPARSGRPVASPQAWGRNLCSTFDSRPWLAGGFCPSGVGGGGRGDVGSATEKGGVQSCPPQIYPAVVKLDISVLPLTVKCPGPVPGRVTRAQIVTRARLAADSVNATAGPRRCRVGSRPVLSARMRWATVRSGLNRSDRNQREMALCP